MDSGHNPVDLTITTSCDNYPKINLYEKDFSYISYLFMLF